jgi:hypothetical protein
VAVIGINTKLTDNLERVLTPVGDVDKRVIERSSVSTTRPPHVHHTHVEQFPQ